MNKKYLLIILECFGLQIFFSVLAMIFYVSVIPPMLYSFFPAWLFLWALHSTFWQLGNKERKHIAIANRHLAPNETPKKQNMLKGALIALPFYIVNVLIVMLTIIFNNDMIVTIQSILHFCFAGFVAPAGDILGTDYFLSRFAVATVMYIPCVTAYISGAHNFSFTEKYFPKLIYKNTTQRDKKDK